ncbi:hypothetical protein C8F01DRAFT_1183213 [Mycena amicta]|nr:hypothetical protein C8F01DRAFT_1183213 [Mycena amicta]
MEAQQHSKSRLLTAVLVLCGSLAPLFLLLAGKDAVSMLEQWAVGLAALSVFSIVVGAVGSRRPEKQLERARRLEKATRNGAVPESSPAQPQHLQLFTDDELDDWLYPSHPRKRLVFVAIALVYIGTTLFRRGIGSGTQSWWEGFAASAGYIYKGVGGGMPLAASALCARLVYRRARRAIDGRN